MKSCPKCDSEHNKEGKFCSRKCANSRIRDDNYKLKISQIMRNSEKAIIERERRRANITTTLCKMCNKSFTQRNRSSLKKTCSRQCYSKLMSQIASIRLSNLTDRTSYKRRRSYLELSFENWLIEQNIRNFKTEVKFKNLDLRKTYFVDFLFEEIKLIVELDGTQHKFYTKQDEERDLYFSSIGYKVLRISHKEYINKTKISELKVLLAPLA